MRAAVAERPGAPDVLRLQEIAAPVPRPDEVLVDVRLAAVNFADVIRRRGETHRPGVFPVIPGIEAMGTIARTGSAVSGLRIGQRVAAFPPYGGYAEQVAVSASLVVPVPDEVEDEQAGAFLVVGSTAFHMLTSEARARAGESVLITAAAGGVGSTAVQLAALLGLGPIIAAAGSRERAAGALRLGATHAIDYSVEDVAARVHEITGGRGVDLVLDAVGGRVRAGAFAALAALGRLVHYGNSSGEPESSPAEGALRESVTGTFGFSVRGLSHRRPELIREGGRQLLAHLAGGRLRIAVEEVLPLAAAAEAHRRLEGRRVTGKLLLRTRP